MNSYLDLRADEFDPEKLSDGEANKLFNARVDKPQLEVNRLFLAKISDCKNDMSVKEHVELRNFSDIRALNKHDDFLQIFTVRQERSWTTLNISREVLEEFMRVFSVFSPFWKCVATFGIKYEEHECQFPGFRSQKSSQFSTDGAFESAYVLRRAELHNRKSSEGQCPWSIRQTAVYHKLHYPENTPTTNTPSDARSRFLLISPSQSMERKISRLFEMAFSQQKAVPACVIHGVFVADSVIGWMGYTAWLEQDLKERSDRITFAKLGAVDKDFTFSVEDRQALKITEDAVIDLQIVITTALNTIKGIRKYCEKCCEISCKKTSGEGCACVLVLEELDDHIVDVELCVERTRALKDRVTSSVQLLSDLLRYEDQRALKDLTEQSATENQTMLSLAERSTKDAEAMKVLTVIGLVYLPTTFIANFFSTEFVRTDDKGVVRVATNTWLLAVLALPLTMLTITIWWLCVRYKNVSIQKGMARTLMKSLESKSWLSKRLRRERRMSDVEDPIPPQAVFAQGSVGTWSTTATTLKEG